MKILLAPSETKNEGGSGVFDLDKLLFPQLTPHRGGLIEQYMEIITHSSHDELKGLFGLKKDSDIQRYATDILSHPTMKSVLRYTGVAFDYLNYPHLSPEAQEYIDTNLIIFSNLFGPIRADDLIPDYRLKQGAPIGDVKVDRFYHERSAPLLEEYLAGEDILDLRAGIYEKFYKPTHPYTTLKFIKDGKVVSHWAKAFRGLVAREVALEGVESLDDFMKLDILGLSILEIQTHKNQTEIIYEIGEI